MVQTDFESNDNVDTETRDSDTDTIENLVDKNMVIAVLADDPSFEYYLLKVISGPETIEQRITDEWGCTFDRGSKVVKGLYYDRLKNKPFLYKLIPRKIAICYPAAVRFICVELEGENKITVPEELHLDIVQSL